MHLTGIISLQNLKYGSALDAVKKLGLVHTFSEKIANKRKLNKRIVSYVQFVVARKYNRMKKRSTSLRRR